MLDVFVRIKESCSANAYIFSLYVTDHFVDGIGVDEFDIVVQEEDVLSSCELHTEIVDGRVVEGSFPLNNTDGDSDVRGTCH